MSDSPFPKGLTEIVVNKQFEMNGYPQDYNEVKFTNFFNERTTTKELEREYGKWLVSYLMQWVSKADAEHYAMWQIFGQGLKTI